MTTEQLIRQYITKSIHMSLGTTRDNKPWVCEVHFAYDEDLNLYWRSKPDRRHSQDLVHNPNVAGNIVGQHQLGEVPHAIYFEGTAELVTDESTFQFMYELFRDQQGKDESIIAEAKKEDGTKFYKVTVENWYTFGKFDTDEVSKTKLVWNGGKK